jgi:radical SAM superfamily enzyme YgiQ (UPF0313 family)
MEVSRIYQLIAYFDLFDQPLSISKIGKLLGYKNEDVESAVHLLAQKKKVQTEGDLCFVPGKEWIIEKYRQKSNNLDSRKIDLTIATLFISNIPYVRAVLLTGSSAKGTLGKHDDYDFFVIVKKNRLWISWGIFTLASMFMRLMRKVRRKSQGSISRRYCCNYYITDDNLPISDKNEFTALEIATAKPLFGKAMYERFIEANLWVNQYFQVPKENESELLLTKTTFPSKKLLESIIDLFVGITGTNQLLDDKISSFFRRRWMESGAVASNAEFECIVHKKHIKIPSNKRQQYLLNSFRKPDDSKNQSNIKTKVTLNSLNRRGKAEKSSDIVLTHAYYLSRTKNEKKIMKPYVPIGPLYVAAQLRESGYDVDFFDTTFQKDPGSFDQYLDSHRPPVVGIYIMETTKANALEMIRIARAKKSVVMVGGPDPTNDPEFYYESGADIVVCGEGEKTACEVMDHLMYGKKNLADIKGIYSDMGYTEKRDYIEDLDPIPFPARDLVDFEPYFKTWRKHHGINSMHLITSRGCPFSCHWCSKPVFGSTFRQRKAESVVDEMLFLKEKYNPKQLWFNDDILGLQKKWIEDFRNEVVRRNAKIPFESLSRVDLVDYESLKMLKEAGCFRIWFGAESGSQKVLDNMNKGFTVDDVKRSTRLAKSLGIEVGFFIMVAYPSESIYDLELTRTLIRETKPDLCGSAVAFPMKGTRFYEEVQDKLLPTIEIARLENDNRVHFKSPYPKFFYDITRRLFTKEVYIAHNRKLRWINRIRYNLIKSSYDVMRNVLYSRT